VNPETPREAFSPRMSSVLMTTPARLARSVSRLMRAATPLETERDSCTVMGAPLASICCWVEAKAGASLTFGDLAGRDVFLYAARGNIEVAGRQLPQFHLAQLSEGEEVTITASESALFLFGHAVPIDEPVVAHGPFVMNSVEEIRQAFADYQAGKFGVAEIVAG